MNLREALRVGGVLCVLAVASPNGEAATGTCTQAGVQRALEQISAILVGLKGTRASPQDTWAQLRAWYVRFKTCDQLATGARLDQLVTRTLARDWSMVVNLVPLANKDAAFGQFVLQHVGPAASIEDLQQTILNAQTECPSEYTSLCSSLITRAQQSLALVTGSP
jgi:hypothetical protein